MSVKDTLQARLKWMRPSEAAVARRLWRSLGLVAAKNLREVAAHCRTSDATVVRACRAAGFAGFQDLKHYVLREFTAEEPPPAAQGPDAYREDITASVIAAGAALGQAAGLIRRAGRVVLAGVGASQGVAIIAADILFTLGRPALAIPNEPAAGFVFTPPAGRLVLLAISYSGETRFTLHVVREARRAGVPSIGLTNEPASELARAVDVLLPTQAVEPARGSYAIAPRVCQLAVLDRLFNLVGRRASPRTNR